MATTTTTTTTQITTARTLIAYGSSCQLTGMVLGMFVPAMPFPRLGLGAHINIMSTGILSLGTGLILYQPNLVQMSPRLCRLVTWGFFSSVLVIASETLNAWWGTNQFLSIVNIISFVRGKSMPLTIEI
jgi:hydroxylaminobenzene mutase